LPSSFLPSTDEVTLLSRIINWSEPVDNGFTLLLVLSLIQSIHPFFCRERDMTMHIQLSYAFEMEKVYLPRYPPKERIQ
jgi:hypothetical protein